MKPIWDVYWAVNRAVYGAMDGAAGRAVSGAVYRDPPHPSLRHFLTAGDKGAP